MPEFGNAEDTVGPIVKKLNPYGLHFVFLDPYNLEDLPFSVIEEFSRLKRIDILIHVSAQDLQRNLHSYTKPGDVRLEKFAPGWRSVVDLEQSKQAFRAALLAHWVSRMKALGLPPARHAELVSGAARNQRLYWLVFVSRSDFAKGFDLAATRGRKIILYTVTLLCYISRNLHNSVLTHDTPPLHVRGRAAPSARRRAIHAVCAAVHVAAGADQAAADFAGAHRSGARAL